MPMLAFRVQPTRVIAGQVVTEKGAARDALEYLKSVIMRSGLRRLIIKSDNEPAIVALVKELILEMPEIQFVPEHSPVGDHESNAIAERAVQELEKQIRVIKSDIDTKFGEKLKGDHPLVSWIPQFAGASLT